MLFLLLACLEEYFYLFYGGASLVGIGVGLFVIVILIVKGFRGNFKGVGMVNYFCFSLSFIVIIYISIIV